MPFPSTSEICWSSRWGLPLEIGASDENHGWNPRFSVQEVRTFAPEPQIFSISPEGLVEIEAGPNDMKGRAGIANRRALPNPGIYELVREIRMGRLPFCAQWCIIYRGARSWAWGGNFRAGLWVWLPSVS